MRAVHSCSSWFVLLLFVLQTSAAAICHGLRQIICSKGMPFASRDLISPFSSTGFGLAVDLFCGLK